MSVCLQKTDCSSRPCCQMLNWETLVFRTAFAESIFFSKSLCGERRRQKNQTSQSAELSAEPFQTGVSWKAVFTGTRGGRGGLIRIEGGSESTARARDLSNGTQTVLQVGRTNLCVCLRSCWRGRSSFCGVDTARC